MTRILICSDIHGNLPAFQALLRWADEDRLDEIHCLGDVLGYYGNASRALREVMERDPDFRIGNHELAIAYERCGEDLSLGRRAIMAAMRHRHHLIKDGLFEQIEQAASGVSRLDTRSENVNGLRLHMVHGSPAARTPLAKVNSPYIRPTSPQVPGEQDWIELQNFFTTNSQNDSGLNLYFVGHSHSSFLAHFRSDQIRLSSVRHNEPVSMNGWEDTVLINVGSVGQPRDNVPLRSGEKLAHGVLVDTSTHTLTFLAAPYVVPFRRMIDDLELESFSRDMSDDLIMETYNALAIRGAAPQCFSSPERHRPEIRQMLSELWQAEVNELIRTLEHPRIDDLERWILIYDHEGFYENTRHSRR
jgi:hypothetical protein